MEKLKKILIVSLDNLGDCVMASSLLRPLRHAFPDAFIGIWVKEYAKDVFSPSPFLNKIHAADPFWDKSPSFPKGPLRKFLRSWMDIRAEKYDLALVINADWRRSFLCYLAGIPLRIGFDRKKSRFFLTKAIPLESNRQHIIDGHGKILSAFFKKELLQDFSPVLTLSVQEKKWVEEWRSKGSLGKDKKIIALHLFSGDPKKNWPLSNWLELIGLITENVSNFYVVVICDLSESEIIRNKIPENPNIEIMGGQSLSHVKAVLSETDVLVGGDSGPGHIAAALGTPVISLFNQQNWDLCGPKGQEKVKILYAGKRGGLSPSEVLSEIREIL